MRSRVPKTAARALVAALVLGFAPSPARAWTWNPVRALREARERRADEAYRRKQRARASDELIRSLGEPVPEGQATRTRAELQAVLDRLGEAQRAINNRDPANRRIDRTVNRLFLIDSEIENMAVLSGGLSGGVQENDVFVTTGILRRLRSDDGAELAGVLAHELAHPLDESAGASLESRWGASRSSQAREIRADAEAVLLLEEAGYPPDGLYRASRRLFGQRAPKGDRAAKAARVAASTHPEDRLRLSAQRVTLTGLRYDRGFAATRATGPVIPPEELRGFRYPDPSRRSVGRIPYREVSDIDDALDAIERYRDPSESRPRRGYAGDQGFGEQLYLLDDLLRRDPPLTDEQKTRITALNLRLSDPDQREYPRPARSFHSGYLDFAEDRAGVGKGRRRFPVPRSVWMGEAPFYRSEEYLAAFPPDYLRKIAWSADGSRPRFDPDGAHHWITVGMPEDLLRRRYPEDFRAFVVAIAAVRPEALGTFAAGFGPATRIGVMEDAFLAAFEDGSPAERERLFRLKDSWRRDRLPFPFVHLRDDRLSAATRQLIGSRDPAVVAARRSFAQAIWRHRGAVALHQIGLSPSVEFDWRWILDDLEIPRDRGYAEIRRAFEETLKSPELAGLTEDALVKFGGFGRSGEAGLVRLHWATPRTAEALAQAAEAARAPKDRFVTRAIVRARLLASDADLFRAAYARELRTALSARGSEVALDRGGFELLHADVVERVLGVGPTDPYGKNADWLSRSIQSSAESIRSVLPEVSDLQARAIASSGMAPRARANLLRALFVERDRPLRASNRDYRGLIEDPAGLDVLPVLVREGAVSKASELLARFPHVVPDPAGRYSRQLEHSLRTDVLTRLRAPLEAEIAAVRDAQELESLADRVFAPLANKPTRHSVVVALRDAATARLADLKLAPAEGLRLLDLITTGGSSDGADAYLERRLLPQRGEPLPADALERIEKMLTQGQIGRPRLRAALASRVLASDLVRFDRRPATRAELVAMLDRADAMLPEGSAARDELLEEIAWRSGALDLADLDEVERRKTSDWTRLKPETVNQASFISQYARDLDPPELDQLVRYLQRPETGMPTALEATLLRRFEADLRSAPRALAWGLDGDTDPVTGSRRLLAQLTEAAEELRPREKVPVFDLLLHSGRRPLTDHPDFVAEAASRYLGLAPGSDDARRLRAFLRAVPPHEASVTLAHLMSQPPGQGGSLSAIFEAFKTVGVKAGQGAHTWKLFGDERGEELAGLKDRAPALSKREFMAELKRGLSLPERMRIRRVRRILGSASLKTVALVELRGGGEIAVAVRNPRARAQIAENLAVAERFLANLKEEGLVGESRLVDSFTQSLKRQLEGELDLRDEARRARRARQAYGKATRAMALPPGGWRIEVASPAAGFAARENVLALRLARGKPFGELNAAERAVTGPMIAEASLKTLFREGYFDADRHVGNQLIDVERRTVHFLDFGQGEEFSRRAPWLADDRSRLAELIYALDRRDADAAARLFLAKARLGSTAPPASALAERLGPVLQAKLGFEDRMIELVRTLADAGVTLEDRFATGALKGLMTLHSEGYVDSARFAELLAQEVRHTLKGKVPATLLEAYREGGWSAACDRGRQLLETARGLVGQPAP